MWTIIQVTTLDNWASEIGRPLLEVAPISLFTLIVSIMLVTFGVLNILLAVMVERMQNINKESQTMASRILEKTEQALMASMADEFRASDEDGSGELDFEEFKEMIQRPSIKEKLNLLGIALDEAENLFEIMDGDKSGTVSPEEFVDGLQKMKGQAKGQDIVQLIVFAQKQSLRAQRFVERLRILNHKADEIQERLFNAGGIVSEELKDRIHAAERNDKTWDRAAQRQGILGKLDKERQVTFPVLNPKAKTKRASFTTPT